MLERIEQEPLWKTDLAQSLRLHYLYERATAGLNRLDTFSSEPQLVQYLENLVSRAYGVVHSGQKTRRRFLPLRWFWSTFPRTFRKHISAFWISLAVMMVGAIFGGGAVILDQEAKEAIVPRMFQHAMQDPDERVKKEESNSNENGERIGRQKATFASYLMANNIRVSILLMALGMTFGVGTIICLFYNGVILGLVVADFVAAGQGVFVTGWLLPHGSIEIPAILLAGQAGLILGSTLIGKGQSLVLKQRLRNAAPEIVTLIGGVAILLVWAGIIEAFMSQYHEPVLPYGIKIIFGILELVLLVLFLTLCGRSRKGFHE